jgi:hypothetical protein
MSHVDELMDYLAEASFRESEWVRAYADNSPYQSWPIIRQERVREEVMRRCAEPHMLALYPSVKFLPPDDLDDWVLHVEHSREFKACEPVL